MDLQSHVVRNVTDLWNYIQKSDKNYKASVTS